MMRTAILQQALALLAIAALEVRATPAVRASTVTWQIDSANSSITLDIPPQYVPIDSYPHRLYFLNQTAAATQYLTWTIGNHALLGGRIDTEYADGDHIQFLPGGSSINGMDSGSYRPDPASFDPYAGFPSPGGSAPGTFGFKVFADFAVLLGIADVSVHNALFELNSGPLPLSGDRWGVQTFSPVLNFGLSSATAAIDATNFGTSVGLVDAIVGMNPVIGPNTSTVADVTYLSGLDRRLDLTLQVTAMTTLEGIPLTVNATASIVAYANVPVLVPLPGDVNLDHIVNGLDISLIASHWLVTHDPHLGPIPGDANGDSIVNGLDIATVASHWLQMDSGAGAAVPEPSAALLAFIGGLFVLRPGRHAGADRGAG